MSKLKPYTFKLNPEEVEKARKNGHSLGRVFRDKTAELAKVHPRCDLCGQRVANRIIKKRP